MERILGFPLWVNTLLGKNRHRLLKIILLTLVFITALYTKQFDGEYAHFISSHAGGVLYVLFGSLLFSVIIPCRRVICHVFWSLAITCMLEFLQWLHIPFMVELTKMKAFAYLLGNSYNQLDFIFYGLGAAMGWIVLYLINYSEREENRQITKTSQQ